jgi:hypothetical protein
MSYQIEIQLNAIIKNHLLEDAPVIITYARWGSEPDVGYRGGIEILSLDSRRGRPLKRILKNMPDEAWERLQERVAEIDYFEAAW